MILELRVSATDYDDFLFAVHVVRAVEWQGKRALDGSASCPACRNPIWRGHADGCEIAQVIAADIRREASEAA